MIGETYREVEVRYDIDRDRWQFNVNGRERSADTLIKARESIDKTLDAVKKEPKKAFQRIKAYHRVNTYGTGEKFTAVEVTSLAEDHSRYGNGKPEFWTVTADGSRAKVGQIALIEVTPENDALIAALKEKRVAQKQIEAEIEATLNAMTRISVPKESE